MTRSLLVHPVGWRLSLAALAAASSLRAQTSAEEPTPLPDYVISATRSPQDPRYTPSAVTLVPLEELKASQVLDLRQALAREPGVVVMTTGPVGGQSSIFLRGASSHQTLFVVDGVRLSDRAASYTNFLGGADLAGLDRLEVLRGPQSTLYGSSALGGVILMQTTHGRGSLNGLAAVQAGSFGTWGAGVQGSGEQGPVSYSLAVARYQTDNNAPKNGYDQWSYAGRAEFRVNEPWRVGVTLRRTVGDFAEVGSRFFPQESSVESGMLLVTAYADGRLTSNWRTRLTLARHERDYDYADTFLTSHMGNERDIADWQNTWQATDDLEIVAGLNYERSRYLIAGAETRDEIAAGYVSATARLRPDVTLTAGLRHDDYESFGNATTGRVGVSWILRQNTKLRATYGTGFSAPGSDDRFGVPSWGQLPNPDLKAEKSRGWDVGIDHEMWEGRSSVSATYFHNRFRNLFEWETLDFTTFEGRIINRARARTEGVELAWQLRPVTGVTTRLTYTYLEARDETGDTRLARRPRHVGEAEVRYEPNERWNAGAGVRVVSDRIEAGQRIEDFTTVRLFGSYAIARDLRLKLRVENALDEAYEEVLGYPSLPLGVYGQVEWHF